MCEFLPIKPTPQTQEDYIAEVQQAIQNVNNVTPRADPLQRTQTRSIFGWLPGFRPSDRLIESLTITCTDDTTDPLDPVLAQSIVEAVEGNWFGFNKTNPRRLHDQMAHLHRGLDEHLRKFAFRWHPDRNCGNEERARDTFEAGVEVVERLKLMLEERRGYLNRSILEQQKEDLRRCEQYKEENKRLREEGQWALAHQVDREQVNLQFLAETTEAQDIGRTASSEEPTTQTKTDLLIQSLTITLTDGTSKPLDPVVGESFVQVVEGSCCGLDEIDHCRLQDQITHLQNGTYEGITHRENT